MSWFTDIRDTFESVAVVAGNYFLPGSSLVTSKIASKGSQEQLDSPLGQVAQLASGIAGAGAGNFGNYGKMLNKMGLNSVTNGFTNAVDQLESFAGNTSGASSTAGQSGVTADSVKFLNDVPTQKPGLLNRAADWVGKNPVPALMAGQAVMAGVGGAAQAEAAAESAQADRDLKLWMSTVQGGFSNPNMVTVNDPNLVTDMSGRYIRGQNAGRYAPGRGLLNTTR